jgi:ribose/xylose/arabinose/galactoside ABC-type transport system permease subunit
MGRVGRALTWEAWLSIITVAVIALFANIVVGFAQPPGVLNVSRAFTILGIIAVGQSLVMAAGGVDLSVGSIFGFAAVLLAILYKLGYGFGIMLLTGVGAGCFIGIINGLAVTKLGFKPFIATFAMMIALRAIAYFTMKGTIGLAAQGVTGTVWTDLVRVQSPLWLYPSFFIILVAAVGAWWLLSNTRFGSWARGTGGNLNAARAVGVPVDRVRIITYVASGALAAVAGMLNVGDIQGVRTFDGAGMELLSLAAVIIGGASLAGGSASILGTLLAVLLISLVKVGVSLMGIALWYQQIITGAVLLAALVLTRLSLRRGIAGREKELTK